MSEGLQIVVHAALIGIGATAVFDLWAAFARIFLGIPSMNWGLVGRWFGHFPRGRFVHEKIAEAPAVPGEQVIGWGAHYLIGIVFAAALLAIWGLDWVRYPTFFPALLVGLATLVAPFLVMQPCMGAGFAASRTPNPTQARLRSLIAHTAFGIGLYASALFWALLIQ
jgi:hypothetical protein